MTRIESSDDARSIIIKMSDGNPGAMNAMMSLLQKDCVDIDPASLMGPFGPLLTLDTFGIYGTAIYILWNDKCDQDSRRFILLLRATQLTLLPTQKVQEMAADQMRQINLSPQEWDELDVLVCNRLTEFMSKEKWAEIQQEQEEAKQNEIL